MRGKPSGSFAPLCGESYAFIAQLVGPDGSYFYSYVHYGTIDSMYICVILLYMNVQTMTAKQARDNFSDLLGAVYYGKSPVIVEKKGRPFAVVINPEEYLRYQKIARTQFVKTAKSVQKRNNRFSEAEVLRDITQEVEDIRRTQHGNK